MKIFSWMQNKLNGKQITTKPNFRSATNHLLHEPCKEEFSDWPNELLAIGTFGSNNLKDPEKSNLDGSLNSCQSQPVDIIPEGVKELHKELKMALQNDPDAFEASAECNLPPEKCPVSMQSLQNEANCDNLANKEVLLQRNTSLAFRRGKDICFDKTNLGIQKRSLTFMLKKAFVCGGEFSPPTVIKDPFPEQKLEKSRMEKILRALLHERIYPRSPSPRAIRKKYLNNKTVPETDSYDETSEKVSDGSKWVKTDSEYIVLEI